MKSNNRIIFFKKHLTFIALKRKIKIQKKKTQFNMVAHKKLGSDKPTQP